MAFKAGSHSCKEEKFARHAELCGSKKEAFVRPCPLLVSKIYCHGSPVARNIVEQEPSSRLIRTISHDLHPGSDIGCYLELDRARPNVQSLQIRAAVESDELYLHLCRSRRQFCESDRDLKLI